MNNEFEDSIFASWSENSAPWFEEQVIDEEYESTNNVSELDLASESKQIAKRRSAPRQTSLACAVSVAEDGLNMASDCLQRDRIVTVRLLSGKVFLQERFHTDSPILPLLYPRIQQVIFALPGPPCALGTILHGSRILENTQCIDDIAPRAAEVEFTAVMSPLSCSDVERAQYLQDLRSDFVLVGGDYCKVEYVGWLNLYLIRLPKIELQTNNCVRKKLCTMSEKFAGLPEAARADKQVAAVAVQADPECCQYVHNSLWADCEFISDAIRCGEPTRYASSSLSTDRALLLEAIRHNLKFLKHASGPIRGCRSFMMEAARIDLGAMRYAASSLRTDRDYMRDLVCHNACALKYAPECLKADKALVTEALSRNCFVLSYVHQSLRSDREVVAQTVRQDGRALQYASMDLREDRDLVMLAVSSNGLALRSAHMDLRADRELVMRAVGCNGFALEFVHASLQADDEVVDWQSDNAGELHVSWPANQYSHWCWFRSRHIVYRSQGIVHRSQEIVYTIT